MIGSPSFHLAASKAVTGSDGPLRMETGELIVVYGRGILLGLAWPVASTGQWAR